MIYDEKIDFSALEDFRKWNQEGGMDLIQYAGMKLTPDVAIAVTKLFFPDFIEYKGAIVFEHKFDPDNFDEWFKYFNGDLLKLEKFINTVQVADLFPNGSFDKQPYKNIEFIGKKLEKVWRFCLKSQFESQDITLIGHRNEIYDDYVITFWKNRISE